MWIAASRKEEEVEEKISDETRWEFFLCKKQERSNDTGFLKVRFEKQMGFFPDGEEYHICPLDVEWDGTQKQSMGIIIIIIIILKKPPSCFAYTYKAAA